MLKKTPPETNIAPEDTVSLYQNVPKKRLNSDNPNWSCPYPSTETGWNKSVFRGEADEMKRLEKVNQRRAIQRSGDALVTFWAKQPDEPFQKHER